MNWNCTTSVVTSGLLPAEISRSTGMRKASSEASGWLFGTVRSFARVPRSGGDRLARLDLLLRRPHRPRRDGLPDAPAAYRRSHVPVGTRLPEPPPADRQPPLSGEHRPADVRAGVVVGPGEVDGDGAAEDRREVRRERQVEGRGV